MADACAKIFEMDPSIIYTKDTFIESLARHLAGSHEDAEEALASYSSQKPLRPAFEAKELIKNIRNLSNQRLITYIIAYALKEKEQNSIFLTRTAFRLLPDQIPAARFLVKYGLI